MNRAERRRPSGSSARPAWAAAPGSGCSAGSGSGAGSGCSGVGSQRGDGVARAQGAGHAALVGAELVALRGGGRGGGGRGVGDGAGAVMELDEPSGAAQLVAERELVAGSDGALHALDDHGAQGRAAREDPFEQPPHRLGDEVVVAVEAQRAAAAEPGGVAVAAAGEVDLDHAGEVEAGEVGVGVEAEVFGHRVQVVEVEQEVVDVAEDLREKRGLGERVADREVDRGVLEADARDDPPQLVEVAAGDGGRGRGHRGADREGQLEAVEARGPEVVGVPEEPELRVIDGDAREAAGASLAVADAAGREADAVRDEGQAEAPAEREEAGVKAVGDQLAALVQRPAGLGGELEQLRLALVEAHEALEVLVVGVQREADGGSVHAPILLTPRSWCRT